MLSSQNALKDIEQIVDSHPVVNHRFLREFGNLDFKSFREFVSQQYLLSISLPFALAHAYGHAHDVWGPNRPNWKLAKPIMAFLGIEHWGSKEEGAHSHHFTNLTDALGLENLHDHEFYKETRFLVDLRTRICREGPFLKAVGALTFANEYVNQHIFNAYLDGARRIRDRNKRTPFPLDYFVAHAEDEIEDCKLLCKVMEPILDHDMALKSLDGTNSLLDARAGLGMVP